MAATTRPGKFSDLKSRPLKNVRLTWDSLDGDDVGSWENIAGLADKTVHVFGEFDGGTLVLQGSNEDGTPTAPVTIVDPQGNGHSFTSNAMEVLLENPVQIRPSVSGGGGSTDLTVIICAK